MHSENEKKNAYNPHTHTHKNSILQGRKHGTFAYTLLEIFVIFVLLLLKSIELYVQFSQFIRCGIFLSLVLIVAFIFGVFIQFFFYFPLHILFLRFELDWKKHTFFSFDGILVVSFKPINLKFNCLFIFESVFVHE